jgi:hypothetical protein
MGFNGILVGAALRDNALLTPAIQRDDVIMWALTDPQRATRVVIDTSDFYVRQLLDPRRGGGGSDSRSTPASRTAGCRCRSPTSPWSSLARR